MTVNKGGVGRLIWSDEFDGPAHSSPNPLWWAHETGASGWGNGELQRYTDDPVNASHDGHGNLIIQARREAGGFTSARLITKGLVEFEYGRLECRARVPKGRGLWSAIWMLGSNIDDVGWPTCGEIDVMENLGAEPNRAFGTVHCPDHFGGGGIGGDHLSELTDDFKIFAVEWLPESISWSVDGKEYFSVSANELGPSWVFNHPFYILINLAVGGSLGGSVAPDTTFPAALRIDYVRAYELGGG